MWPKWPPQHGVRFTASAAAYVVLLAASAAAPRVRAQQAARDPGMLGRALQLFAPRPTTLPADAGGDAPASEPAPDPQPTDGQDIRVSPQGRVEMHVRDLDLGVVLQALSLQSRRNIVASKNVTGKVTANLYEVTLEEALKVVLAMNNAGVPRGHENDRFIYVFSNDELKGIEAAQQPMVRRLIRLQYVQPDQIRPLIEPLKSRDGTIAGVDGGGGARPTMSTGTLGNGSSGSTPPASIGNNRNTSLAQPTGVPQTMDSYVLVIDHPENVAAIEKQVASVDIRPRQVLVEAVILRAQLNEENALGIDFNIVGGVDFRNLSGTSNAMTDLTLDGLPQQKLDDTTWTTQTDFRSAVPRGGFTFGIISNNVAMFIRALEQVTDTTVLANPKILALDRQPAQVIVGRRDGYLTTTVTETAAVQQVQFLETGTQLIFYPLVTSDGYVQMLVQPKDSTGGLTASNLPYEQTTEVGTNILVRDGHTILIGGLFREVTAAVKAQVPVVGNVPVAGALFRNSRESTQREEVIILLTVHIVKDEDAYAEAGRQIAEDVERYRVGMRKGLQCYGRERLAQAHYQWALHHLKEGHERMALWDLDLAINNNPTFLAAIKMKEQVQARRAWDEDGSAIRVFVAEQIMREQCDVHAPFDRPEPPIFEMPDLQGPCGFDKEPAPEMPGGPEPARPHNDAGVAPGAKGTHP